MSFLFDATTAIRFLKSVRNETSIKYQDKIRIPALNGAAESTVANSVAFDSNGLEAFENDIPMVVAYDPAKNEASYLIDGTRADKNLTLLLPERFSGDEAHCFIAFKAAAGSKASNSIYLGTVTVA